MTTLASDDFNRADGGLGANWTTLASALAPQIVSNQAAGPASPAVGGAGFTGTTWPNNQWASVIIGSQISDAVDEGAGPLVRGAVGVASYYFAQAGVDTRLYRRLSGSYSQLGSTVGACVTGDVLRLEVNGTSLTVFKNGTPIIGPITDTNIAAGNAGIWTTRTSNAVPYTALNDWSGGDFNAGGNNDLAGTAVAGAIGTGTLSISAQLAGIAIAGAIASGALDSTVPLTAAAIARAVGVAALEVYARVWRIPVDTPNGTLVKISIFVAPGGVRSFHSQGYAIVAGGFADLPTTEAVLPKALAFVDNWDDDVNSIDIFGGPAIATLTDL